MYTATKTANKGKSNGQAYQEVQYTDGADTVVEVYRTAVLTPDWPDAIARGRLDQLNSLDISLLKAGALDAKPVVTPPTQAELDKAQWIVNLRTWKQLKAEVDLGFAKATTQADVDAAYATVKTGYLPGYGTFL